MYNTIPFQLKDSPIHSTAHSERVLLYALLMGNSEVSDDEQIDHFHASIFHDTRREDRVEGLQGHGARTATFYQEFCKTHARANLSAEAAYLMRYHDRRDERGEEASLQQLPGLCCLWY